MITVKIDVTTKKGTVIPTTWGIQRDYQRPDFEASCGRIRWRNASGLFKEYHQDKADGLATTYRVALLRSDLDVADMSTRQNYAGWAHNNTNTPNPGSFALRGADLGEITGEVTSANNMQVLYIRWRVRGWNEPTDGERAFLNEHVKPFIAAAIAENADALKAEAVEALREHVRKTLAEARASLDKAEKEMAAAIAAL